MQILELELKEFGRHRHLTFDSSAAIIGITGPNGAGKTLILAALRWLMTGYLGGRDEPMESFVYNWGSPSGANNCSVRGKFVKNGQIYEIFRQAGKTGKRWLKMPGAEKPETKAAEVDKHLSELFGANRDAIASTVFIPQGALDKLFFGNDSEREELFVDLLLLGHLSKVHDIVDTKIKQVSAGIQDLSILTDDLARQRNASEEQLLALDIQMKASHDWAEDLRTLRAYNAAQAAANKASENIDRVRVERTETLRQISTILANELIPGHACPSAEELSPAILRAQNKVEELREAIALQQSYSDTLEAGKKRRMEQAALRRKQEDIQHNLAEQERKAHGSVAPLQTQIEAVEAWKAGTTELTEANRIMKEAQQALAEFETKEAPDLQKLEEMEKQLGELNEKLGGLRLRISLGQSVGVHAHLDKCPLCDSHLDGNPITAEKMQQFAQEEREAREKVAVLGQEIGVARRAVNAFNEAKAKLVGAVATTSQRVQTAALSMKPAPSGVQDVETLRAEIQAITTAKALVTSLTADAANVQRELAEKEAEIQQHHDALVKASEDYNESKLKEMLPALEQQRLLLNKMTERAQQLRPTNTKLAEAERMEKEYRQQHEEQTQEAKRLNATFSAVLRTTIEQTPAEENVENILQVKADEFNALRGRVEQAQKHADELRVRQNELDKRAEDNIAKQGLINELKSMKEAFSRRGVCLRYITHRFTQLAQLTRHFLAKLEANFTVEVDPTKTVSFTFIRLDEPEPYAMSQIKFSGGQKVRLAVAFLLAIQRLVVPEVGFLVLDEPSLHLDDEGKEQLAAMLRNMAGSLGNSESQIWVCDHSPILETAYQKNMRLGPSSA